MLVCSLQFPFTYIPVCNWFPDYFIRKTCSFMQLYYQEVMWQQRRGMNIYCVTAYDKDVQLVHSSSKHQLRESWEWCWWWSTLLRHFNLSFIYIKVKAFWATSWPKAEGLNRQTCLIRDNMNSKSIHSQQKRWNDQFMILFCWIVNVDIATEVRKSGSDAE